MTFCSSNKLQKHKRDTHFWDFPPFSWGEWHTGWKWVPGPLIPPKLIKKEAVSILLFVYVNMNLYKVLSVLSHLTLYGFIWKYTGVVWQQQQCDLHRFLLEEHNCMTDFFFGKLFLRHFSLFWKFVIFSEHKFTAESRSMIRTFFAV